VALIGDPVLTVWQAMNLLHKVYVRSEAPEISKILTEAETILFSLVTALVRRTKRDQFSSEGRVISH